MVRIGKKLKAMADKGGNMEENYEIDGNILDEDTQDNPAVYGGEELDLENLQLDVPAEMMDFIKVMEKGAEKYEANNWLLPNGHCASHRDMHASMFRHLADSHAGNRTDADSGLDPLLHLAARALMVYTRYKKGIYHSDDVTSFEQGLRRGLAGAAQADCNALEEHLELQALEESKNENT